MQGLGAPDGHCALEVSVQLLVIGLQHLLSLLEVSQDLSLLAAHCLRQLLLLARLLSDEPLVLVNDAPDVINQLALNFHFLSQRLPKPLQLTQILDHALDLPLFTAFVVRDYFTVFLQLFDVLPPLPSPLKHGLIAIPHQSYLLFCLHYLLFFDAHMLFEELSFSVFLRHHVVVQTLHALLVLYLGVEMALTHAVFERFQHG